MMSKDIDPQDHFRGLKQVPPGTYKFEVGVRVACKPGPFAVHGQFTSSDI